MVQTAWEFDRLNRHNIAARALDNGDNRLIQNGIGRLLQPRTAAIFQRLLIVFAWVALTAAAPGLASAQTPSRPQPQSQGPGRAPAAAPRFGAAMDVRLDNHEAELRAIRLAARTGSTDDAALQAQKAAIEPIQADLADALSTMAPRMADAAARLAELGPAPAAGQPREAPDVAEARAKLLKFQKTLEDNSKRARLLSVEASQLSDSLAGRLRKNFSARLWTHSRSVFDPTLWGDFAANLPDDLQRIHNAAATQLKQAAAAPARRAAEVWSALLAALGLFLLAPARIILNRLGRRWSSTHVIGSGLHKSALALWLTLVGAATPPLAGVLLHSALSGVIPLTPTVDGLVRALIDALLYAAMIDALGRSLLSPGRPDWRLTPVSNTFAVRLAVFPTIIGVTVGLAGFLARASVVLGASDAANDASRCLGVIIQILAVGGALAWARSVPAGPEDESGESRSRLP